MGEEEEEEEGEERKGYAWEQETFVCIKYRFLISCDSKQIPPDLIQPTNYQVKANTSKIFQL